MLYVSGSEVVPVMVPSQASVAVGAVAVAEHSPVTLGKFATSGVGVVLSSTIMF